MGERGARCQPYPRGAGTSCLPAGWEPPGGSRGVIFEVNFHVFTRIFSILFCGGEEAKRSLKILTPAGLASSDSAEPSSAGLS